MNYFIFDNLMEISSIGPEMESNEKKGSAVDTALR